MNVFFCLQGVCQYIQRYPHQRSSHIVLLLFLLPLSFVQASAPASFPEASTELICRTQHGSECYPAIFQPTEHFQPVHHDQFLPAGLNFRTNLATGLKEARLNVPEPPGTLKADLVDETFEDAVDDAPLVGIQDQTNPDRDYPHRPSYFDPEESSLFASSASTLRASSSSLAPEAIRSALEILTELCHDYHWGRLNLPNQPIHCWQTSRYTIPGCVAAGDCYTE